ncbi:MAG: ATP-binding protein, partial [Acidimicrobiales bacterium]
MARTDHDVDGPDRQDVVDDGRTFSASLFTPADTGRRERRREARSARAIEQAQRRAIMAQRRRDIETVKAERRAPAYLPRGGETGLAALRSYRRLRVEPHRATSDVFAGAYPFLAEAGLGTEGVFIGTDSWSAAAFVYDPWVLYAAGVLTNPNQVLAGVIGKGKS